MNLKYSAFTENTTEMREWSEKLGITRISSDIGNLILVINGQYMCFELDGDLGNNFSNAINCLGNPALFKAVTAVREDSDKDQWFVFDEDIFDKDFNDNVVKIFSEGQFTLCHNSKIYSSLVHKATLSELQEHFKIN
ncbi:hypothetical protein JGH11_10995 [Dysgonomonas sp. Marseille-P4677]|uniref:hypothetical protein n=1 Tax=Dysgonomonas sp. Marseille-P4677 TaxID=2364790 RepID=UPI001913CD41|nr:hypothetical protein [Dysgonomonas sp. Marseille-P4677]MBK5721400.1 hypothetical protein [Dysgonomonas sp. Marseille-P4677]